MSVNSAFTEIKSKGIMTFLNPMVLLGLIAATIPVILHLLNLRKLKNIEFSTLRFLKELQKNKIRKLKLKQIILLILRTLIILFAVFAFSRPTVKSNLPLFGTYAKTSIVILLDNSFSMDVSDELGNRFNQAKNQVQMILKTMKDGDEAAIVLMTDNNHDKSQNIARNISFLKEELSKVKISLKSANLFNSLRKASTILEESNNINREVFILSDAQPNIFINEMKDSLKLFGANTSVYFMPYGSKSKTELQNLSIDSVGLVSRIFQKGKLAEVEARIRNNSSKDAVGVIVSMFFNNERVAQKSLDIPANQIKTVSLASESQRTGVNSGRIEIESDALETDNKRHFAFIIPDKPNVLAVGSDEKNLFIKLVLNGKTGDDAPANIKFILSSEIASYDLSSYDNIILAGGPLRENDFQRLYQYVKNGGSLLLFANDETPTDIFKYGLKSLGFGDALKREFSGNQPAGFTSVDRLHPLFEGVFKGETDRKTVVESPKIFQALTVNGGQSIIDIPGGSFISESRLQDGKALYVAVKPTTDWSSFPLTGVFPAFLYRSVIYLSSRENIGANNLIGKPLLLNISNKFAGSSTVKIIDPNKNESFMQTVRLPSGTVLSFENLLIPGVYSVYAQNGKGINAVSVNTDPTESNINSLTDKEITGIMKTITNKYTNFEILDYSKNSMTNLVRARTGTELWQLMVVMAIICMAAEMIVEKSSKSDTEK